MFKFTRGYIHEFSFKCLNCQLVRLLNCISCSPLLFSFQNCFSRVRKKEVTSFTGEPIHNFELKSESKIELYSVYDPVEGLILEKCTIMLERSRLSYSISNIESQFELSQSERFTVGQIEKNSNIVVKDRICVSDRSTQRSCSKDRRQRLSVQGSFQISF